MVAPGASQLGTWETTNPNLPALRNTNVPAAGLRAKMPSMELCPVHHSLIAMSERLAPVPGED